MIRTVWGILVILATAGASPAPSLPVPPIPPADAPADQSAPMPDLDARAPSGDAAQHVTVSVQDFRVERFYQGLAFSPGSRFATSEEKRPIQTPGVTVQVPLQ